MTQRLGRRSAGERVAARASRLSDDLLLLEEECFAAVGKVFGEGAVEAEAAASAAWGRARQDPAKWGIDSRMFDALTSLHAEVLAATRPLVAGLAAQVTDLAVESIGEELTVCEETLAKRFRGLAAEAVVRVEDRRDGLVTARLDRYEDALQRGQAAFAGQVRQQVWYVAHRGEDWGKAWSRLFAEDPNRLLGNGGRGIWWRASSGLNAAAREVSIRLASTVRLAAMEEFNAAGAAR